MLRGRLGIGGGDGVRARAAVADKEGLFIKALELRGVSEVFGEDGVSGLTW